MIKATSTASWNVGSVTFPPSSLPARRDLRTASTIRVAEISVKMLAHIARPKSAPLREYAIGADCFNRRIRLRLGGEPGTKLSYE